MRRPRRFAAIAGSAALLATTLGVITLTPAATGVAGAVQLASPKADIVVDAGTGRILIADNIHTPVHPASTAKIMTALTAVERLCPGSLVTATAQDAAVETMRIGLPVNKPWPFDDMMASMMMVSANDAAYAFAHTIGGSLDAFQKDLNTTAKQLGLRDSTLGDPAGLDDQTSYKGGPFMSAYDLAIATRNALTVPEIAKWSAMHQYSFTDPGGTTHTLVNHNKMLPGGGAAYSGAIGFKTGFTQRSQHTLVAAATRNGRTLIAVVLGVPDSGYQEAASLLDAGFGTPANTKGTGQSLPPVKVSRCGVRAADQAAFAKLGTTVNVATATGTPGTTGATVPASVPVFNDPPLAGKTTSAHTNGTPTSTTPAATKHHSPGLLRPRNLVIVLILVLAVVIAFRRRAVKRQRAIRLARRRQRISAMRSGGLPVVDGRYRAGTRIGPPVESHVRVRPVRRPGRPDPA
jgi:serine-type D-Ala-D-Ala carboxypeptidase (penicillin-binding protein 5/6)